MNSYRDSRIKIIIAEENQFIRKSLSELIDSDAGCRVLAEVSSGSELVTEYFKNTPDLMLVNIVLPGLNGIEAFEEIKSRDRQAKVLFTTGYNDDMFLYMAFKCGGAGYYYNSESPRKIINYIKEVTSGTNCFPDNTEEILARYPDKKVYTGYENNELLLILSKREYEIFLLCGTGLTSREISNKLQISLKTVEFHLHNMRGKLNLRNRVQLIGISAKHNLLYGRL